MYGIVNDNLTLVSDMASKSIERASNFWTDYSFKGRFLDSF